MDCSDVFCLGLQQAPKGGLVTIVHRTEVIGVDGFVVAFQQVQQPYDQPQLCPAGGLSGEQIAQDDVGLTEGDATISLDSLCQSLTDMVSLQRTDCLLANGIPEEVVQGWGLDEFLH